MTKLEKTPSLKFNNYQIFVVSLLAFTQFTIVLDFMIMSPLGDILMKSIDLSTTQFGFAVSAYAFSAGLSGLLTAGFADKFDRKKLLLIFYTGFILGTFLCGMSNTYPLLIAARIITGIFGGVIGAISMAIVADLFPFQQRGRVMGFMQMGFGASQVLGIPIGLILSNTWGWQSPFFMIVGLATITWFFIFIKLKPIADHLKIKSDHNPFVHFGKTFVNANYRVGFLATALLSIGGFLMMPWGSAFAINNLNVTHEQLPFLFMASGLATLIVMPIIGKLCDRFDKFVIFLIASIWLIIIVLIYTNMTPVPLWLVILVNVILFIGIMGRMIPSMALVTAVPQMQDRGAFMSINSSLQQIAGGIAAGAGGLIVYQKTKLSPLENYNILGYLIIAISITAIFLVYRMNQMIKTNKKI